jgi:hypothetical protein
MESSNNDSGVPATGDAILTATMASVLSDPSSAGGIMLIDKDE